MAFTDTLPILPIGTERAGNLPIDYSAKPKDGADMFFFVNALGVQAENVEKAMVDLMANKNITDPQKALSMQQLTVAWSVFRTTQTESGKSIGEALKEMARNIGG